MPVPFDATTLKSWFQTGDQPTQQQFADWIDTMFYQLSAQQGTIDALVAAAAADTRKPIAGGHFIVGNPCTVLSSFGVSAITRVGQVVISPYTVQNIHITFTTPFADEFYQSEFFVVKDTGTRVFGNFAPHEIADQTPGYVFVQSITGRHVTFLIFRP